MSRAVAAGGTAGLGMLLIPVAVLSMAGGATTATATENSTSAKCDITANAPGRVTIASDVLPNVLRTDEQRKNAETIISVGQQLNIPTKGLVIAIATALQESTLINVEYGDTAGPDSVGLFQQRDPWGKRADRLDPAKATKKFFTGGTAPGTTGLLDINGWETTKSVAQAAQAVQRSAFPFAYASWEDEATEIVSNATGADRNKVAAAAAQCEPKNEKGAKAIPVSAEGLPAGYRIPAGTDPKAAKAITWALKQVGTLYEFGGTCTDPHGSDPSGRCDCSSLMMAAYREAGVDISRTTISQATDGRRINPVKADLHPGDLVFVPGSGLGGTVAVPRHVGLYLGAGLIVQAPGTGKTVKISELSAWMPLAKARRVVG